MRSTSRTGRPRLHRGDLVTSIGSPAATFPSAGGRRACCAGPRRQFLAGRRCGPRGGDGDPGGARGAFGDRAQHLYGHPASAAQFAAPSRPSSCNPPSSAAVNESPPPPCPRRSRHSARRRRCQSSTGRSSLRPPRQHHRGTSAQPPVGGLQRIRGRVQPRWVLVAGLNDVGVGQQRPNRHRTAAWSSSRAGRALGPRRTVAPAWRNSTTSAPAQRRPRWSRCARAGAFWRADGMAQLSPDL